MQVYSVHIFFKICRYLTNIKSLNKSDKLKWVCTYNKYRTFMPIDIFIKYVWKC